MRNDCGAHKIVGNPVGGFTEDVGGRGRHNHEVARPVRGRKVRHIAREVFNAHSVAAERFKG